MRILFTNDDGYNSVGLHAVADLFKDENEIAVVAPNEQKSGYSHSITMPPLIIRRKVVSEHPYKIIAVSGTPADCVKIALSGVFPNVDAVVSGINAGRNLGSDLLYSATVAAAADAALFGVKAFALSRYDDGTPADYAECARFFKNNFQTLMRLNSFPNTFINVNFPAGTPVGAVVVKAPPQKTYVDFYDAVGRDGSILAGGRRYDGIDTGSDEWFCKNGYITITPVTIDRTDYSALDEIKNARFVL